MNRGGVAADVLAWLERAGPSPARALERALGRSRAALLRDLALAGEQVLVAGRARATRYAARRAIELVTTPIPVYEVDRSGEIRQALTLHPVEPLGFYVEGHVDEVTSGFVETDPRDPGPDPFTDLPWFLLDIKPAGFLGRAWVRAHDREGYPLRLEQWSSDHVLRYASLYGTDLPGAFVLGEFAASAWRRPRERPVVLDRDDEARRLPELVHRMLTEEPWGSSPGGEQPKLTASWRAGDALMHGIAKFSGPLDNPVGRRWADLLVCEHLAHEVVREQGIEASRSRLVDAGERRFLVVERFDRIGARGRAGVVSLAALDRAGVSHELRQWSLGTAALVGEGRLSQPHHEQVCWLQAFGTWIGNTDMHPGNLSFRMRGTTVTGLAPVYDMLPMCHAPLPGGEVREAPYDPRPEVTISPAGVTAAARSFWERVACHAAVSEGFRRLAEQQAALIPG